MTYEDARKILLSNLQMGTQETADALCKAVDALEKQIPKKPEFLKKNIGADSKFYQCCPICQEIAGFEFNYCDNCGQRLDWSDEK